MRKLFTLIVLALAGVGSAEADLVLRGNFVDDFATSYTFTNNQVTLNLDACTTYQFKIVNDGTWEGNNGTMTWKNCSLWDFKEKEENETRGNCSLSTTIAGAYTFTYSYDSENSVDRISVTYPESPSSVTFYLSLKNLSNWTYTGEDAPYVYFLSSNTWSDGKGISLTGKYGTKMSKVSDGLYRATFTTTNIEERIVFTKNNQDNYNNIYDTEAIYRGDCSPGTIYFESDRTVSNELNNTTYRSKGTWYNYPTYARTGLATGSYYTLCLPFDATIEGATAYSVAGKVSGGIGISYVGTSLTAGTPYVIKATATSLTATYSGTPAESPVSATALVGKYDLYKWLCFSL